MSNSKLLMAASAAASLLGAAGAVRAATTGKSSATLNSNTFVSTIHVQTGTGSGTATLNNTGTFTFTGTELATLLPPLVTQTTITIGVTDTFTGSISGHTFTASGGAQDITSCTGTVTTHCPSDGSTAFTKASGTVSLLAGGTGVLTGTTNPQGTTATDAWTVASFKPGSSTPPPVPLPPAVWLLGSGLLGLVGTARRRLKVTEG